MDSQLLSEEFAVEQPAAVLIGSSMRWLLRERVLSEQGAVATCSGAQFSPRQSDQVATAPCPDRALLQTHTWEKT